MLAPAGVPPPATPPSARPTRCPASGFDDVPEVYADAVDCIAWYGITVGNADGDDDPSGLVLDRAWRVSLPLAGELGNPEMAPRGQHQVDVPRGRPAVQLPGRLSGAAGVPTPRGG